MSSNVVKCRYVVEISPRRLGNFHDMTMFDDILTTFPRHGDIVNDVDRRRNIVNDVARAVNDIVNDVGQARPGKACHRREGLRQIAVTEAKQSWARPGQAS